MRANLIHIWLSLVVVLILNTKATGQDAGISFIENKGQWRDSIKYKAVVKNGELFITDQGFVLHFIHEGDLIAARDQHCKNSTIRSGEAFEVTNSRHHAYNVRFIGAQRPAYIGDLVRPYFHNYFIGKDSSRWQSEVKVFGRILQKGVYPGIDMAIYSEEGLIKYDFIVHPGSDPGQIQLEYQGVPPRLANNGDLIIKTTVNTIIEKAPIVYQEVNGKRIIIPSRYKLVDNRLSYEILSEYDTTLPLVIDPTLVFATYSGGTSWNNLAYASTYDESGNFYSAAFVASLGWPTSIGAFQTNYSGEHDIGINKYNEDGSALLYSTYLGGNEDDQCVSMMVNPTGDLIIAAVTESDNMPVLPNSFQGAYRGNKDIYLAKLNSTGTALLAATYFGSGNTEGESGHIHGDFISPVEIGIGTDSSIWIISNITFHDTVYPDIPLHITSNAFQAAPNGGVSEGIVAQFTADMSENLFSTYIGGDSLDVPTSLLINKKGDVIISGITNSTNFPTTSGSLHSDYVGGAMDGFITIIDAKNYELLQSTFIGTEAEDLALHLQTDELNNVVVLGQTMGNYPISLGVYSIPTGDLFIDKLSADLSQSLLSTRLGNEQQRNRQLRFSPKAFLYDYCGRTYITGYGGISQPTTNDQLVDHSGNPYAAGLWIGVLERNFSNLLFGSYYGTEMDHPHAAVSRFDPKGSMYQNVCSGSIYYPTTSISVFPVDQNSNVDAISFKIDLEAEFVQSIAALPLSQSDTGCAPYTVQFQNNTYSRFPVQYAWDFGDGSPIDTNANPTHTFTNPSVYQVVLKAFSPESCNMEDFDTLTIAVFLSEGPDIFTQDTAVCQEVEALKLWVGIHSPLPSMTIEWSPESGIIGPNNTDTISIRPEESRLYAVRVRDTSKFCSISTDSIHIDYYPRGLELLNHDTVLCKGDTLNIRAVGSEGYSYSWSPVLGVSDSSALEPHIIATESQTYTLTATHPDCEDSSQHFALTVDTPYQASFLVKPNEVCVGHPVYLYPVSDHSTTRLTWTLDEQTRVEVQTGKQYQHAFDRAGTHPISLKMQFRVCPESEYTGNVSVYPLPELDLGGDTSLCLHGAPVYLKNLRSKPSVPHHHRWSTGDTSAVLKAVKPGTYSLSIATDPIGCTSTESVEISKDCYIDVPNAFSPNGDGHNDYFFPRQLLSESVSRFKMKVYNRWGQIVFETSNRAGQGWDGRFNGQNQPIGVYLYRIEAEFFPDRWEVYEGNITLLR